MDTAAIDAETSRTELVDALAGTFGCKIRKAAND